MRREMLWLDALVLENGWVHGAEGRILHGEEFSDRHARQLEQEVRTLRESS
jgi:hypothetical protein